MSRREKIIKSLATKEAREAFVESNIETGISFQVRENRMLRHWSQKQLADESGKKQPYIARLEGPGASLPNIQTLLDLAAAFDCALIVRFAPFSELINWVVGLPGKDLSCPSFLEDRGLSSVQTQTGAPVRTLSQQLEALSEVTTSGAVGSHTSIFVARSTRNRFMPSPASGPNGQTHIPQIVEWRHGSKEIQAAR